MNRLLWSSAALSLLAVSLIAGCAHHRQSADACGEGCCGTCDSMAGAPIQSYAVPSDGGGMPEYGAEHAQGMPNYSVPPESPPAMPAPAGSGSR